MKLLIIVIGLLILFSVIYWLGIKYNQFKDDFQRFDDDEPLY